MSRGVRALFAFAGFLLFGFGLYILPFGTDFYMYFWVEKVFHGNWLYGDIAANVAAISMIIIGLVFLHAAGKKARLEDALPVEKKAKKRKGKKMPRRKSK